MGSYCHHLYTVQAIIGKYQRWVTKRKQRQWRKLIENHYRIAQSGRMLWAKAVRVYEDKRSFEKIRLVRVQLHIELSSGTKVVVMSKCLLQNHFSLEGKMIRFKFLLGDLSQIVLCY